MDTTDWVSYGTAAFLVVAGAVAVPVGGVHELLVALGVALAEQVAGALPAEHVARRLAPGRAMVVLVAGQEVHEQRRLGELPALALAARQDVAEELLGLLAREEMR